MDRKLLGKRIREERLRSGLTQEQLAEQINVSTTYIGLIERGERAVTLEKIILLANCLHVTIDTLLNDFIPTSDSIDNVQLLSLWNSATQEQRAIILELAKSVLSHITPSDS